MSSFLALLAVASLVPVQVAAQNPEDLGVQNPAQGDSVASAPGATLRSLDRLSGEFFDIDLRGGERAELGKLEIRLTDCRYPAENPSGDAYAYLSITDQVTGGPLFQGWMIASSPALNALDHMRYDVWVLRCSTS